MTDLRLIVITDHILAAPRDVVDIVHECLRAGAPAVQLRDKGASARELLEQALQLRALTREFDALLFVNDRFDVALAASADGVHVGPDDVPVARIRAAAPGLLIGASTDDPERARQLARDGASYIGCGAVFGTTTKTDIAGEVIGLEGLRAVVEAVTVPVVAIGGVDTSNAQHTLAAGAAGVAVVGAIMRADDPGAVVRSILRT